MQIRKNLYSPDEEIGDLTDDLTFETIIHENEAKIINLVLGMTGDYHIAQDLTQETFIKAFKARQSFKGYSKLSTWLYRIAVNTTLDYQRKSCVSQENPALEIAASRAEGEDPDHTCQKTATRDILFQAIAKLPPQQREVFTLREINGCSTKEAAEVLNISVDLVKWRLHKARLLLRKSLAGSNLYQNIGSYKLNSHGIE